MENKRTKSRQFYFDNVDSPLVNPFLGKGHTDMCHLIDVFMDKTEINRSDYEVIARGAFLAQDRRAFSGPRDDERRLTEEEIDALDREKNDKWNQPFVLYALVACCSLGAAVQGWDEVRHAFIQLAHCMLTDLVGEECSQWRYYCHSQHSVGKSANLFLHEHRTALFHICFGH